MELAVGQIWWIDPPEGFPCVGVRVLLTQVGDNICRCVVLTPTDVRRTECSDDVCVLVGNRLYWACTWMDYPVRSGVLTRKVGVLYPDDESLIAVLMLLQHQVTGGFTVRRTDKQIEGHPLYLIAPDVSPDEGVEFVAGTPLKGSKDFRYPIRQGLERMFSQISGF